MTDCRLEVFPASTSLATRGADLFFESALNTLSTRPSFHAVLAGGRTPLEMFRVIEVHPLRSSVDWSRVNLYWGDERSAAFTSDQNNFGQAWRNWLARSIIPASNLHPFRTEIGLEESALEMIRSLPDSFDIAYLGMGEDGHVASLFPENAWPDADAPSAFSVWVPHLGSWRLSLSPDAFARARLLVIMVSGRSKAEALLRALAIDSSSRSGLTGPTPVARILDSLGDKALILSDEEAAALLPSSLRAQLRRNAA